MSGVIPMDLSWLEQAAQLTIVLGFCGGFFSYLVIRPLTDSIKRIENILGDVRDELKHNNERLNRLEGELSELKRAVQRAHQRIDDFLRKNTLEEATM